MDGQPGLRFDRYMSAAEYTELCELVFPMSLALYDQGACHTLSTQCIIILYHMLQADMVVLVSNAVVHINFLFLSFRLL